MKFSRQLELARMKYEYFYHADEEGIYHHKPKYTCQLCGSEAWDTNIHHTDDCPVSIARREEEDEMPAYPGFYLPGGIAST